MEELRFSEAEIEEIIINQIADKKERDALNDLEDVMGMRKIIDRLIANCDVYEAIAHVLIGGSEHPNTFSQAFKRMIVEDAIETMKEGNLEKYLTAYNE